LIFNDVTDDRRPFERHCPQAGAKIVARPVSLRRSPDSLTPPLDSAREGQRDVGVPALLEDVFEYTEEVVSRRRPEFNLEALHRVL